MNATEHKFLCDFQPLGDPSRSLLSMAVGTVLNWIALFGVFYVIGRGLKLGLGI